MTEFEDEKDAVEFKAQGEPRFLLYPAAGDIDEDEGLTELEMLEMLAAKLGYTVTRKCWLLSWAIRSRGNDLHKAINKV